MMSQYIRWPSTLEKYFSGLVLTHTLYDAGRNNISISYKYDRDRQFYLVIPMSELGGNNALPGEFTNIVRRRNHVECQTLDLMKRNQLVRETDQPMDVVESNGLERE